MRDFDAFRHRAIRYWERRRIIYNLALVPPALLTYVFTAGVASVGDEREMHPYYVVVLFTLSALGANICYTCCYALEFLCGRDDPQSRWMRGGRSAAFASGIVFAILLAVIGGRNIAFMEFYFR